ncbi:MAG: hypothetical protein JWO15_986 [Sphingomonadales bacterium]|nr:hypothetical protein [Sphingomonadales bacterium]
MFQDDRSHYQHRAEIEVARAQKATISAVVQAHYKLVRMHFKKVAVRKPDVAQAA